MQALRDRHSTREFSSEKLAPQVLANLLWAAFGINRPGEGKRTAPSAMNWQEVDIYVATAEGLYVYDAKGNKLDPILAQDVRAATGVQPFVKDAPVGLVYVADFAKTWKEHRRREEFLHRRGCRIHSAERLPLLRIGGAGRGRAWRGGIEQKLAKVMKLRPDQRILLAQTVGYPKK